MYDFWPLSCDPWPPYKKWNGAATTMEDIIAAAQTLCIELTWYVNFWHMSFETMVSNVLYEVSEDSPCFPFSLNMNMSRGYHWHQGGAYTKSSSVNTVISFHCLYSSMAFLADVQWPCCMMFSTTRGANTEKWQGHLFAPTCAGLPSKKKRIKIN